MEEWIRIMKRMMLVFIAGVLAVTVVTAVAEEADADWTAETIAEESSAEGTIVEEASSEETCAHEHTVTAYYFDAPEYFPLGSEDHMVVGPAIVEVTCQDCGAVISVTQESNAQEIRSHVFRNGVCALCGYESAMFEEQDEAVSANDEDTADARAADEWTADEWAAEEWTADEWAADEWAEEEREQENAAPKRTPAPVTESVLSLPAGENPDQYVCTLTGTDLENAGDTLVIRPDGRDTAIAVKTDDLRREIDGSGTFIAQIAKPGDETVSTSIRLYDAYGMEAETDGQDISLRIYAEYSSTPLTVTFTDSYGFTITEEARWENDGYWIVPWHGDGQYAIR